MNRISKTLTKTPYIYGIMTVTEHGEVILPHQAYRLCSLGPRRWFHAALRPQRRRKNTTRRRNDRTQQENS